MSNIEEIPGSGERDPSPPDSLPPAVEPGRDIIQSDDIREPSDPAPPIEPDPQEGDRTIPDDIERA
ncbi:hypothetical protein [Aureimonas sp. ME7]|uniref:hypothetical protein n=1 Tax=Aureimonas sp. ME7 TaxID=2744252 RepID=UPI0015F4476E|nr:hypothetical protein [Aureimonas sp. ME7]